MDPYLSSVVKLDDQKEVLEVQVAFCKCKNRELNHMHTSCLEFIMHTFSQYEINHVNSLCEWHKLECMLIHMLSMQVNSHVCILIHMNSYFIIVHIINSCM